MFWPDLHPGIAHASSSVLAHAYHPAKTAILITDQAGQDFRPEPRQG
jgi:hypothetical protein